MQRRFLEGRSIHAVSERRRCSDGRGSVVE